MPRLTNKNLVEYGFKNPYRTIVKYYNHKKTLVFTNSKFISNNHQIVKINLDNPNSIKDVDIIGCFDGIYENFFPIATARHIRLILKFITEKKIPYRFVKEDGSPFLNVMGNQILKKIKVKNFDEECPICLGDDNKDLVQTKCGHIFHKKCIKLWLNKKFECALCRNDLSIIK